MKSCGIEGCTLKYFIRGYCSNHYKALKREGVLPTLRSYESHGMKDAIEYNSWINLRHRTTNPKNKDYERYKDFKPCVAIDSSFSYFMELLGYRPHPSYSIDRIDNTKGYWCGSCTDCVSRDRTMNVRWASSTLQNINKGVKKGKTYPMGVHFDKKKGVFIARCTVNRKSIWLGEHRKLEDAVAARQEGEKQYYKELR